MRLADPDLDVANLFQQALEEVSNPIELAALLFKVDVGFPQQLRHVRQLLIHGGFEDGANAVVVLQRHFQLSEADPGLCVGRVELDVLLTERAAAGELVQSGFE